MRKFMIGLLVAIGLLAGGSARASYVCSYTHYPPTFSPTAGSYGYLTVSFYTQPHCAGSFAAQFFYCSSGATASGCATTANCGGSVSYLYTEMGLHSLLQVVQGAAVNAETAGPGGCTTVAGTNIYFSHF